MHNWVECKLSLGEIVIFIDLIKDKEGQAQHTHTHNSAKKECLVI